jgi:NADH-quinone oxidoreductase subunit M
MPIFPSLISIAGFSIKVPLWPFSSWLLKAHVEASTEFSIFLSGFLVKFGVFSIWKLSSSCSQQVSDIVLSLSYIGIIDGALRLVSQVDLKRVVASLTVIEAN